MTVAGSIKSEPISSRGRVSPALVGGRRMYVECPSWCVTDHLVEAERCLADVEHRSTLADLLVPGGEEARLLAFARLGLFWEWGVPRVVVGDDSGPLWELSPEQAEDFATQLEEFAAVVRAQARSARE